jgi:hypothetical protein
MKIDFGDGGSGFFEARAVHRAVREARGAVQDETAREFLAFLDEVALTHLQRPEFAALREQHGTGEDSWPSFSMLKHLWRQTMGAQQFENSLSEQRSEALARAERAEHSAFRALADAARMERERDRALAEIAALKQQLEAAQVASFRGSD